MFIVYKLTSPSGLNYIGQTGLGLEKRFYTHLKAAKDGNTKINKALRMFPHDSWKKEILLQTADKYLCYQQEQRFIQQFDSFENGYNSSLGGEHGSYGRVVTEETRKKLAAAKRGKKDSFETLMKKSIAKIIKPSSGMTNKKHSEETKQLIGQAHIGTKCSEETKQKIRQSRLYFLSTNTHGMLGKKHSEETKRKMSTVKRAKLCR